MAQAACAIRELYCPAHFGNTYECALDNEMTELLSEARFWGFNRYSDWFDTIDLYDVYARRNDPRPLFNLPEAMWARKLANFAIAGRLGFELGLVITPNHVFSDQVTPANAATPGDHMFGQLVCPSRPGVTEMIVGNYRHLFNDFVRRGLRLRSISACPYDYGGCGCDACRPWVVAFGKLTLAIVTAAREVFGTPVEMDLIGWWWSDEDHRAFTAWADREAPGQFTSMAYHLPYDHTAYGTREVPRGCDERAFVHIGYGERSGADQYGHCGPTIAPTRLEQTVAFLRDRNAQGLMAYSEGQFDEINKAILAGLASGAFARAEDVLKAYARRHLSDHDTEAWATWIASLGEFEVIDAPRARAEFEKLKNTARSSWRLEALEDRLRMAEANAGVRSRTQWDAERRAAAKAFFDAKEHLFRRVWGLGLQRHIFRVDGMGPRWIAEYRERSSDNADRVADLAKEV